MPSSATSVEYKLQFSSIIKRVSKLDRTLNVKTAKIDGVRWMLFVRPGYWRGIKYLMFEVHSGDEEKFKCGLDIEIKVRSQTGADSLRQEKRVTDFHDGLQLRFTHLVAWEELMQSRNGYVLNDRVTIDVSMSIFQHRKSIEQSRLDKDILQYRRSYSNPQILQHIVNRPLLKGNSHDQISEGSRAIASETIRAPCPDADIQVSHQSPCSSKQIRKRQTSQAHDLPMNNNQCEDVSCCIDANKEMGSHAKKRKRKYVCCWRMQNSPDVGIPQHKRRIKQQRTNVENKVELQSKHTQTEYVPEDLFISSSEDLVKLLHCPVCRSIMEPPVYICSRGHSLCCICRVFVNDCPTCEAVFPPETRNFTVESLMDFVYFPCKNGDCSSKYTWNMHKQHTSLCLHREIFCHFQNCLFRCPLLQYETHIRSTHADNICLMTNNRPTEFTFDMKKMLQLDTESVRFGHFVILHGHIFALFLTKQAPNFVISLNMIGTASAAAKYRGRLRFESQDASIPYSLEHTAVVPCDYLDEGEMSLNLGDETPIRRRGLIGDDGKFRATFTIFEAIS